MKRPVVGVAVALVIAIGAAALVFNRSNDSKTTSHPLSVTSNASISIDAAPAGAALEPRTYGMSIEATELSRPQFGSGNVAKLLKDLGPGVLRIGGSRVDDTFWTSSNERAPEWSTGTITPNDLDRVSDLAKASGWTTILGVNLKHFDPARAADEARHAQDAIGSSLQAVAIGNEPSLYYPSFPDFKTAFDAYVSAIKEAVPNVSIVGADTQHSSPQEQISQAFADSQHDHLQISGLAEHHYSATTCGERRSSIEELLSPSTYLNDKASFDAIVQRAKTAGVPGLLDETNSVSCEGQPGVSDTFASALWALSYGLEAAHEGLKGVYFHGSFTQCKAAKGTYKYYTPMCAATKSDFEHSNMTPQPEYYGMQAIAKAGVGNFLPVSNSAFPDLHAYAIAGGNSMRVIIVNLEANTAYTAKSVSISVPPGYSSAKQSTLQTIESPALSAKSGVSFSDSEDALPVVGDKVEVVVPSPGAVVLTLNP